MKNRTAPVPSSRGRIKHSLKNKQKTHAFFYSGKNTETLGNEPCDPVLCSVVADTGLVLFHLFPQPWIIWK